MIRILRDKQDGKSSGLAIVEYSHPVEAVQAISMFNNQMYYDRQLNISLDKTPEDDSVIYTPDRLPDGLNGVGIGLGPNGWPLLDVENNLPRMCTPPNYTNHLGTVGNLPIPSTGAVNVPALEAIGQNILASQQLANQQNNTNTINAALGILQSVPGMSSLLSNLTNGNAMAGCNVNTMPMNQIQAPSNVAIELKSPLTTGLSANLLQSIQGQAAVQANNERWKQESLYSVPQAQLNQTNTPVMMNAPKIEPGGFSLLHSASFTTGQSQSGLDNAATKLEAPKTEQTISQIDRTAVPPVSYANGMDVSGRGYNSSAAMCNIPSPTLVDTVVVRNLPDDCNAKILRDGFSQCGEITYCEIKAPGTGLIRFDGAKSAQIAIARMNNQNIAGKNLTVEYL